MQKSSKKQLTFEKLEHFKNFQKRPRSKGYRLCKIATLAPKLKMHKNILKGFVQHIAVVICKNASKNHLVFEKLDHFENCQKWPPCRGYRLRKIVTLVEKIKMHKNMLKMFWQDIAVVLCKNCGSKNKSA